MMSKRAAPNVRYFLGRRLRALRAERGMTQLGLGRDSGLTATFIGQVERGQKSISVDSLYHIASALKIPLRWLTDVPRGRHPSPDAERLFALVACVNRREDLTRVYRKLTSLLGNGRSNGRRR